MKIEFTVEQSSDVETSFNSLFGVYMPQYMWAMLDTGEVLVVLHANSRGEMPHKAEAIEKAMREAGRIDFFACCHPAQAKAMNPEIAFFIIGDWSEKTSISLFENTGSFNRPEFKPQSGKHFLAPTSEVKA